ncbi:ThiJ/PfpI family protein [Neoasaia chiangmaiensis NBRC 101099]|uniref:Thiamine biosynthesis protein ThiJ n=1 Tax=Neoasaia chiangmaiensis TaxID=320497 RepID=A0A1U9KTE8_9PROT|nr:thiamine biosynthesis protein ThiJ [Neoasaia chiangmaiensis]GBR40308.1 ThiJ/PfpI family protein [Neoasaia chiangmaiensis NBRC 101099]GEN13965.1 protease I [Neoasaia chiangmaiensis]
MTVTQRILIVVTNIGEFDRVGYRTGLWLSELTHFWDVLEAAGYSMDIVSPGGGPVPIDPESLIVTEMGAAFGLKGGVHRRYKDRAFMNLLRDTRPVSAIDPSFYDAIYLTGGHGVMFDFASSRALTALIGSFLDAGKLVAAVCHGPSGLLDVQLADGRYLVDGRNVTGFSWREEVTAKRDDAVPFSLEDELQKRGGRYSMSALPFVSHIVEDGLLITGQNPASAHGVGQAVVRRLGQGIRS